MKKHVTFADSRMIRRLHQHRTNEPKHADSYRPPATGSGAQTQHVTTAVAQTVSAASFLKHSALTPAQRSYLYTVATCCSSAHVRSLITRHYMNVLHRCKQAGCRADGDDLLVTSVTSPESGSENPPSNTQSENSCRTKHRGKIRNARNPGESFLPKIPTRAPNTSASKHRKMKKHTASAALRGKSPRRGGLRRLVLEDEGDGDPDDCLSERLSSSLSVGEWDDDIFSDSQLNGTKLIT